MNFPVRVTLSRRGVFIETSRYPTLMVRWNLSHYWLDMNFEAAFPSLQAWRRHNAAYSQHCLEDSLRATVRCAIQRAIHGAEYEPLLFQ
ncbi:MAG: hypothetical protein WC455_30145 [Dehalococcoidia bacterium]